MMSAPVRLDGEMERRETWRNQKSAARYLAMMLEIVLLCVTPLILLKDCNIAGGHLEPHFEAPFFVQMDTSNLSLYCGQFNSSALDPTGASSDAAQLISHVSHMCQADLGNFALSTLLAACIILSGGSKKQLSNFGIQARSGRDTRESLNNRHALITDGHPGASTRRGAPKLPLLHRAFLLQKLCSGIISLVYLLKLAILFFGEVGDHCNEATPTIVRGKVVEIRGLYRFFCVSPSTPGPLSEGCAAGEGYDLLSAVIWCKLICVGLIAILWCWFGFSRILPSYMR